MPLSNDIKWWQQPKICRWQPNEDKTIADGDCNVRELPESINTMVKVIKDFNIDTLDYPKFHFYAKEHVVPRLVPSYKFNLHCGGQGGPKRKTTDNDDRDDAELDKNIEDNSYKERTFNEQKITDMNAEARLLFPTYNTCPALRIVDKQISHAGQTFSQLMTEIDEYNQIAQPVFKKRIGISEDRKTKSADNNENREYSKDFGKY